MPTRTLVLGGTSFFGREIVHDLLDAGHEVTVFTRGRQQPDFWDRVDHIEGDRFAADGLKQRLADRAFDVVIDNIAFEARDVEILLDALGPRVGHYVVTSTCAIYRYAHTGSPLLEDAVEFDWTPPRYEAEDRSWQYAKGKLEVERATMRREIPWTIIRPPIVLGPHDVTRRGFYYFYRLMDGKPIILRDGGVATFRLANSTDLARAYRLAAATERSHNRVYNICQPEMFTLRLLLETAAEALDRPLETVSIPGDVLDRTGVSGGPYGGQVNFVPAIERARRELGYMTTPFKAWLTATARWYRDDYDGGPPDGYEGRDAEVSLADRFREAAANLSSESG
jgi:nucleoside-diphosphate-sugar epimerase